MAPRPLEVGSPSGAGAQAGLRPPRSPPIDPTPTPTNLTEHHSNLQLDITSPQQATNNSGGAATSGGASTFSVPSTPISPARVLHSTDSPHGGTIHSPTSHTRSTSTPDSGPTSPEFISPALVQLTLQQQRSLQGVAGAPSSSSRAASIRARLERSATMSARSNLPKIGSPILTSARGGGVISPQSVAAAGSSGEPRALSLKITSPQNENRGGTPNRLSMSSVTPGGLPLGLMRRPSSLHHQRAPSSLTPGAPRPSMLLRRASVGPLTATHSTQSTQQNILFAIQQHHQQQSGLSSRPSMSTTLSRQGSGKSLTIPAASVEVNATAAVDEGNPFESDEAPTPHFNPAYAQPTQQHHARFASMAGLDMSTFSTADLLATPIEQDLLATVEEIDLGTTTHHAADRQKADDAEFARIMRLELVFIYLFFLTLVCNLDGGSIPASLVNLKQDFPASTYSALGALSSVNIFGLLIGSAASGSLLARFSHQGVLCISLCTQALFIFLFGIVHNLGFMTFARFIIGCAQGPLIVFIPLWVRFHAPSIALYSTWNTLLHVASPLGMAIGYIVGIICSIHAAKPDSTDKSTGTVDDSSAASAFAWKWAFLVQSFILAPMALALFLMPKDLVSTSSEERQRMLLEQAMQARSQQQFGQMMLYQQSVLRDRERSDGRPAALNINSSPAAAMRSVASARGSTSLQPPRPSPFASALSAPSVLNQPPQGSPHWFRTGSDGSVALAPSSSVTITSHHQVPYPSPSFSVAGGGVEISSSPHSSYPPSELAETFEDDSILNGQPEALPLFDTQELASMFTPRHRVVAWGWSPSSRSDQGLWAGPSDVSLPNGFIAELKTRVSELKDHLRILLTNWLYVSMVLSLCCLYFLLAGLHFWITPYLVLTYSLDLSIVGWAYVLIAFVATPCGVLLGRHAMQQIEARLDARYDRELVEPPPSNRSTLHPADDDSDDRSGPLYDTVGRKSRQLTKQIFALILACAFGIGVGCLVIGIAAGISSSGAAFVFVFLVLLLGGALVPCCSWILDGSTLSLDSIPVGLAPSFSQQSINLLGYFLAPIAIGGAMDSGGITSGFQMDLIWSALLLAALFSAGVLQWRECAHQRTLEDVQRAVHMTIGTGVEEPYIEDHDDEGDNPALSPRVRHTKNGESVHFSSINPAPSTRSIPGGGAGNASHGRVSSTGSVGVPVSSDEPPSHQHGVDWLRRGSVVSYDAPEMSLADLDVISQSAAPSQPTTPLENTQYSYVQRSGEYEDSNDFETEELTEAEETYLYGRAIQDD
jgi:MFS family permease